jgi:hypothetical protein
MPGHLRALIPSDRFVSSLGILLIAFFMAASTSMALCPLGKCIKSRYLVIVQQGYQQRFFLPFPIIRSPSQCPGTALSSTSGGRFEIITILDIGPDFLVCP